MGYSRRFRAGLPGERALFHPDHRRPRTRREFIAQGFMTGAAMVMVPTLASMLKASRASAQAASCGVGATANRIPFLCFDLAGGANIAGSNVMVGGPGGQADFLPPDGYTKLGIPTTMAPSLPLPANARNPVPGAFGLLFHHDSAMLAGMLSKCPDPQAQARVNGVVFCARSENDTSNNPHNPMYGINKAGADGALVTLIGTEPSESGGNSVAPMSMIDPKERPVKVDSPADVTGLVDTGRLVQLLSPQDAASVMSAVEMISEAKLQKMSEDAVVEQLVRCGYAESSYLVKTFGDPAQLDPLQDPDILSIISAQEIQSSSKLRKVAAVMKMVVNGFAGAGTVEGGGYDYHDGTRATGEVRDFEAGQQIGAAIMYAHKRQQQLVVYVFSDGALDSDNTLDNSTAGRGKGNWRGDNQSTAAVFMLVYDPAGQPQLTKPGRQIGYYRPSGDVETNASRVSNNVNLLAEAIVLNFMALHDDVGRFAQVLPSQGLGSGAQLDALIGFQPIRPTPP
jgi:hypothetical protein